MLNVGRKRLFAGIFIGTGIGLVLMYLLGFGPWRLVDVAQLFPGIAGSAPEIGARAPNFELVMLSGGSLRLNDLQGKPVLINFWATWCGPCVREMPDIQKFYEKYPGQFEVIAVNADEPVLTVQQFVQDIGLTFPILLDPGGKVQELYRLRGYPSTYFLDAQGVVQYQHIGTLTEDKLAEYLANLGITP